MSTPEKPSDVQNTPQTDPTEGGVSAETSREGQIRAIDQNIAAVEERARAAGADKEAAAAASVEAGQGSPPQTGSGTPIEKPKSGWSILGSLSDGWKKIAEFFGLAGGTIDKWLKKWLNPEEEKPDQESEVTSTKEEEQASEVLERAGEIMKNLKVHSWEEVQLISDPQERVFQAALYAKATELDCFTGDGNHCSGWCDSVFEKAGLDLYSTSSRIYVGDYKDWPKRGTLEGLKLQRGDAVLRWNGNRSTGHHHEIILDASGPDADGYYKVTTVGQVSVKGESGDRRIRTLTIKAENIRAVTRPGATQPWNGANS